MKLGVLELIALACGIVFTPLFVRFVFSRWLERRDNYESRTHDLIERWKREKEPE